MILKYYLNGTYAFTATVSYIVIFTCVNLDGMV